MDKNQVLLSQSEIDALLNFLTEKQVSSAVMSQESIDRLVEVLQSQDEQVFRMQDYVSPYATFDSSVIILPGNVNIEFPNTCRLSVETDDNGCFVLYCTNPSDGTRLRISHQTVEKLRYFPDDTSNWGRCLSPALFDIVASLLKAKYLKKDYDMICHNYATLAYGNPDAQIANIYLPPKDALEERLIEE